MAPGRNITIEELAREKLTRVLGATRAAQLFDEALHECGVNALVSADDLFRFGEVLARRNGFEGTVGAMLKVQALMRGASGQSPS